MTLVTLAIVAYLIGSIPFAVLVSRVFALPDPRSYGSGNPGATNVLRTGNKAAAALTLLSDVAKGWLGVHVAQRFADPGALELTAAVAAVAVCIGHMYSVFLRFDGGKGVATALGVLAALDVYVAAGTLAIWLVIAIFFRISSLAALASAAFAPFLSFLLYGMSRTALEPAIAVAVVAVLVVWRHRSNIRNLMAGTEGKMRGSGPGAG
ncbi:MAG: glycerol-3-phosphate 1-O-acyltransferase PlsY [Betaproteobacteria bacterium]|nr:glycerol-3-phosphate 1-O-acyltransferase PlsY [Betaproteobacteria bacterium]